jgi:uncharacterized protein with ParB-like and HNH nuclease domain
MDDNSDVLIEEIKAESDDFYSDDDIYNFNSWGADLSFRELIDRYETDELLKPELQRHYVWDKTEASRFIDSILLGLPVPSIFLAKTETEKLLIIDGYQRIMTVHDFVKGIFNDDKKVFKLTNSIKINPRWRGKAFTELSAIEQRRIRNTTIHAIIFSQKTPISDDTGMYQVFERINTGGRTLFPQEIRNCVYQKTNINKLLMKLNNNKEWRPLFGSVKLDSRMRDMEMILRFFALKNIYEHPPKVQTISLKKELNLFMSSAQSNKETSIIHLEQQFDKTVSLVTRTLGLNAFHNLSPMKDEYISKFNPTIFDAIMVGFSLFPDKATPKNVSKKRFELLRNTDFQDAIRFRTTDVEKIKKRIDLVKEILLA